MLAVMQNGVLENVRTRIFWILFVLPNNSGHYSTFSFIFMQLLCIQIGLGFSVAPENRNYIVGLSFERVDYCFAGEFLLPCQIRWEKAETFRIEIKFSFLYVMGFFVGDMGRMCRLGRTDQRFIWITLSGVSMDIETFEIS